jgi:two-component system OmpR family sensor kinase
VTGGRSLSLRARMLVTLVGVTTLLLLVMGSVSTFLLARRVDGQISQFNKSLRLRADWQPVQLQQYPDGYAAVEVPLGRQLAAVPVTGGQLTAQLVTAVDTWLRQPGFARIAELASQPGPALLTGAKLMMQGSSRCTQFPYLRCPPFRISSSILAASRLVGPAEQLPAVAGRRGAILLVAQQVSTAPTQVRGFIIAELITGAALIALLAVGGEWLIGQGLEPLDQMTATANEITTRGDLTARMPDADDQTEVGRLGASINTMLDRIQQAFSMRLNSEQKVREFAADASHELRTPLTTIRGYAELYRQGALGPDQLPSAMRRIEQEAHRMSTLVAELLELARLDRTSSLDLTETDLASVVRDAVADAVAVEPQRPVRAEAPPRLVAVVDEPRIRQVLANLLGNVRTHTPVTTPVAVRLGAITGGVLLEVADAGQGMSADDAIRAFDRFHRAAERNNDGWAPAGSSPGGGHGYGQNAGGLAAAGAVLNGSPRAAAAGRVQAAAERSGGSGLGLSIVQAIASAHGGRATLESRPGKGTKVRVWLPVRIVP